MRKTIKPKVPREFATFQRAFDKLSPERQAKFIAFMKMLARDNLGVVAVNSGMRLDWNAVCARVAIVGKALDLPASEMKAATLYKGKRVEPIAKFADRYHQDLNWLLMGAVGSMCHQLAFKGGWRPAWWDAGMEAARFPEKARVSAPEKRKTC